MDPSAIRECALCLGESPGDQFPQLRNCQHLTCVTCLQQYVRIEIQEGRVNLKCPQCSEILHPNDIEMLVGEDRALIHLYESLMLRRVLAADPDTRWCPAPNCTFAVVATGCASCPKISCEREGCDFSFCYHCKAEWHPNQTCDMARHFMEETIKTDYVLPSQGEANDVTILWDRIMTSMGCCGVNSYLDFVEEGSSEVPPSCCQSTTLNLSNSTTIPTCPDPSIDLLPQMTQGCYPLLLQGSVPAIASSLAVVIIFQLAGVILSCCLASKVDDNREWYEMTSM